MKGDGSGVVVRDIGVPFWPMVKLMIKWALAAIPAGIILFVIAAAFMAFFAGMVR